jgi:YD repeat-containing protein
MVGSRITFALVLGLTSLAMSSLGAQSNNSVQYFYDDLGRLVKVIDQNGNIATYY